MSATAPLTSLLVTKVVTGIFLGVSFQNEISNDLVKGNRPFYRDFNCANFPIKAPAFGLRDQPGISSVAPIPESVRRGEESNWAARQNREW